MPKSKTPSNIALSTGVKIRFIATKRHEKSQKNKTIGKVLLVLLIFFSSCVFVPFCGDEPLLLKKDPSALPRRTDWENGTGQHLKFTRERSPVNGRDVRRR